MKPWSYKPNILSSIALLPCGILSPAGDLINSRPLVLPCLSLTAFRAFFQHLLHPGVQHKFFALEGLTRYSSHNKSASGRCGNTKEGPSIHLRVIVRLISRNLLVDWLHAKEKRECPEKGNTQTFPKERWLVIDGPEELGILLVGETMDGARKGESWTLFSRQQGIN